MSAAKSDASSTATIKKDRKTIDYNAKAKVISLVREREKEDFVDERKVKCLNWEGKEFGIYKNENCLPNDRLRHPAKEDLETFLEKNFEELNHGDLLTTKTTDRASGMHIVCYDEERGRYEAILNTDEGGSGYLTIPSKVLRNVTNAMRKYEEVFQNSGTEILNMHISPKDEFITERLGNGVYLISSSVKEIY